MFKKRIIKDNNTNLKRKIDELENDKNDDLVIQDKVTPPILKKKAVIVKSSPKDVSNQLSNTSRDQASTEISPNTNIKSSLKPVASNIKITTITDFQPDVCKDFLQTGYCGYGDTCKFLHIREESKQKKPIKKEWEDVQRRSDNESETKTNPFKCVLCKEDYKSPIKTQCNHLYCKECFLNRYKLKKKPTCFICDKDTNGVLIPVSKQELSRLIDS